MSAKASGWGWPSNSRKAHYFNAATSRSLCGKWMFFGALEPDDAKPSRDDCVVCRRKLEGKPRKATTGNALLASLLTARK